MLYKHTPLTTGNLQKLQKQLSPRHNAHSSSISSLDSYATQCNICGSQGDCTLLPTYGSIRRHIFPFGSPWQDGSYIPAESVDTASPQPSTVELDEEEHRAESSVDVAVRRRTLTASQEERARNTVRRQALYLESLNPQWEPSSGTMVFHYDAAKSLAQR